MYGDIFLTIRTTHTHYQIYVQHRYAKKEESERGKKRNDVMALVVISSYRIFALLFLKYDLSYVRNLCVFVLDEELL